MLENAKKELELAGFYDKDAMYGELLPNAVLELLEVFSKQGHSGMSASVTIGLFKTLAEHKPLTPLTDDPNQWSNEIGGDETYQNTRFSAVFKNGKEGKPYYLDAIVWQGEEDYDTFTGRVEDVQSRQYVRLPFIPKTFYVDVVKEYHDGKPEDTSRYYEEDYTDGTKKYYRYVIKDRKQLEEVFTYYEEYPPENK